jgi:perosamine synthetase
MTNVQAAILLGQLENIPLIHKNKQRVFDRYKKNLQDINGIFTQQVEPNTAHSMWMFGCKFDNLESYRKAELYFSKNQIDTRPMFYSYKNHKHLNFTGNDNIARKLNKQIVIFPSYPELKDNEIDYVCEQIIDFNNSLR